MPVDRNATAGTSNVCVPYVHGFHTVRPLRDNWLPGRAFAMAGSKEGADGTAADDDEEEEPEEDEEDAAARAATRAAHRAARATAMSAAVNSVVSHRQTQFFLRHRGCAKQSAQARPDVFLGCCTGLNSHEALSMLVQSSKPHTTREGSG